VGALKRVREKGDLSLVCPQRQVRRVFEITGLTKVFPMFDRLEDAVASCPVRPASSRKTGTTASALGETSAPGSELPAPVSPETSADGADPVDGGAATEESRVQGGDNG
jgi:hypothetical protein